MSEGKIVPHTGEFQPYQIVIAFPSVGAAFEQWIASVGWQLSPLISFDDDDMPCRFIQPTDAAMERLRQRQKAEADGTETADSDS